MKVELMYQVKYLLEMSLSLKIWNQLVSMVAWITLFMFDCVFRKKVQIGITSQAFLISWAQDGEIALSCQKGGGDKGGTGKKYLQTKEKILQIHFWFNA